MSKKQEETLGLNWLYNRGYTLKQAKEILGCDGGHLSRVLAGKRVSAAMVRRLRALPKRKLDLHAGKEMAV